METQPVPPINPIVFILYLDKLTVKVVNNLLSLKKKLFQEATFLLMALSVNKRIEMKNRILKSQNKIIAFILSVLGIGSTGIFNGCSISDTPVEYGTPSATFIVKGKVANETGINGIKVKMSYDSTYTNESGRYEIEVIDFPMDQEFQIQFEDIDGEANNEYQKLDTVVAFVDPEFDGGDGSWYSGETTTEFDVKLKEKN